MGAVVGAVVGGAVEGAVVEDVVGDVVVVDAVVARALPWAPPWALPWRRCRLTAAAGSGPSAARLTAAAVGAAAFLPWAPREPPAAHLPWAPSLRSAPGGSPSAVGAAAAGRRSGTRGFLFMLELTVLQVCNVLELSVHQCVRSGGIWSTI